VINHFLKPIKLFVKTTNHVDQKYIYLFFKIENICSYARVMMLSGETILRIKVLDRVEGYQEGHAPI
jgi:hypothetical protein